MRSNDRKPSEDQANTNDRSEVLSLSASASPLSSAPQFWVRVAEATIDWYGAMFRLAFGLGRINEDRAQHVDSPPPRVVPLPSSPPAAVQAPRKRRKAFSSNNRSRSSKTARDRRSPRAA